MRSPLPYFLLLALLLSQPGCFTRRGPRFDPYAKASTAGAVTNLTQVDATNAILAEWLHPSTAPFCLGPGDEVDIELLNESKGSTPALVGPDGMIYYQLLPGLNVSGLTLSETKALLEKELSKYVRDPSIAITLRKVESKRVWVLGRLNTPGIYPITTPMTLIESITKAGGLFTSRFSGTTEELADLHHSFVIRQGRMLPVKFHELIREGDMSQNIYLEADDFIYLPSALSTEVYVLGAVYQPRAVGFKDQLTLVSAIADARGTITDAYLSHVAIVRGSLASPEIAIVNYKAIVTGKAPDVRLEPRDIVFVPFTPYRTLKKYANLIINTFARTVAANEGIHAARQGDNAVGVNIDIGH